MLFLTRERGERVDIGSDSWVIFLKLSDGDAHVLVNDGDDIEDVYLQLDGEPYLFKNGAQIVFTGFSHGEATIGFDAPMNLKILREEVDDYTE